MKKEKEWQIFCSYCNYKFDVKKEMKKIKIPKIKIHEKSFKNRPFIEKIIFDEFKKNYINSDCVVFVKEKHLHHKLFSLLTVIILPSIFFIISMIIGGGIGLEILK